MTRSWRTRALTVGAAMTMLAGVALTVPTSAQAAVPTNDDIASAQRLKVQTRVVANSREATSHAADGRCVDGSSVWYRVRLGTAQTLRLSTVGSQYDTMLAVFSGGRNARTLLRCNDDAVGLRSAIEMGFAASRTYWVAVSACCSDRARGGPLVLTFSRPAPLSLDLQTTEVASGGTSGRLIVNGTSRCTTPAGVELYFRVSQRAGDHVARGEAWGYIEPCRGQTGEWSMTVDSETGWAFQPGAAIVTMGAWAYNGFESASIPEESSTVTVVDSPNQVAPRVNRG